MCWPHGEGINDTDSILKCYIDDYIVDNVCYQRDGVVVITLVYVEDQAPEMLR